MKVKCDYCGQMVDETLPTCPNCGGTLSTSNRVSGGQPKTIEELKAWYEDHHLPPEDITRFYIGKDIKHPKAFGIYKNSNGDFVVYKNKANGERAVRYEGADEAYAVNELYQRLRAEIADQKAAAKPVSRPSNSNQNRNSGKRHRSSRPFYKNTGFVTFAIIMTACVLIAIFDKSVSNGYYSYNGQQYYHQGSSWYYYNSSDDDWDYLSDDDELNSVITSDTYNDYRVYSHEGSDFEDSIWYDTGSSDDDDDWDSDSSWGSDDDDDWGSSSWDSWDSGGSDWDSDW